jgi:hypothetical protein
LWNRNLLKAWNDEAVFSIGCYHCVHIHWVLKCLS